MGAGLILGMLSGIKAGSELQAHLYPREAATDSRLAQQEETLNAHISQKTNQLDYETRNPQANPYAVSPDALRGQIAQDESAIAQVVDQRSHDGTNIHNLEFVGGGMLSGILLLTSIIHGVRYYRYKRKIDEIVSSNRVTDAEILRASQ